MSNSKATRYLNGRHVALMFAGFFAVVFAVNIGMAVMASRSWTGLVVENSYVASQSFNSDVAALRKSEGLGLSHQMHYEGGRLLLSATGVNGLPIATDKIQITIGRPVDNGEDQILTALRTEDGKFAASAKLGAGIWTGELSALVDGKDQWRQPFRLIVSGE